MPFLPARFRFSWKITVFCLVVASVMIWCAQWQWGRYHQKLALLETYSENSRVPPLPFPLDGSSDRFEPVLNKRVRLKGRYDYERQVIVTNKKHRTGPGHWLLTPLIIEGSGGGTGPDTAVLVSRGFIPFADRTADTWEKYNFAPNDEFDAVVKKNIPAHTLGPKNPEVGEGREFQRLFFFPEISKMARQLPYPVITDVFVQRIGRPPHGEFPAEAISIEVPPSTHFGYTIEWSLLATATLVIGFLLQAFPREKRLRIELNGSSTQGIHGQNGSHRTSA